MKRPQSAAAIARRRTSSLATLGTAGDPTPNETMIFPANDPFNSWVQHGAIFKNAPHKAAVKLFLSWLTSRTAQQQPGKF